MITLKSLILSFLHLVGPTGEAPIANTNPSKSAVATGIFQGVLEAPEDDEDEDDEKAGAGLNNEAGQTSSSKDSM